MRAFMVLNDELEYGRLLVDALVAAQFDVRTAFWAKPTEASKPYFYVVTPKVDDEGPGAAYRFVHEVLRTSPDVWIKPLDVRVVGVKDSLGEAALKAIEPDISTNMFAGRPPRPYPGMTRISERTFGGLEIDWAYIYPPPSDAPAKQS